MRFISTCLLFFVLIFISGCNSLFYYPDSSIYFLPKQAGLSAPQELNFTASDGVHLHGWFFKTQRPSPLGTIIQFHGNAQNSTSHFVSLAWLVNEGYDFFTFDYRGYGDSDGEPSPKGTYLDGLSALKEAYHLKRSEKHFIVYGQSLGGAIAARAVQDWEHRDQISLLVLDSTFSSYKTVARRVALRHWFTWPLSPVAWLIMSDQYSTEKFISEATQPLLIIHDKLDPVVPFACGEDIFLNANKNIRKDFWILNDGFHVGIFGIRFSENRKRFLNYVNAL
jgi:fermentation-respiration switch protein FrsA (DUF1100 family)